MQLSHYTGSRKPYRRGRNVKTIVANGEDGELRFKTLLKKSIRSILFAWAFGLLVSLLGIVLTTAQWREACSHVDHALMNNHQPLPWDDVSVRSDPRATRTDPQVPGATVFDAPNKLANGPPSAGFGEFAQANPIYCVMYLLHGLCQFGWVLASLTLPIIYLNRVFPTAEALSQRNARCATMRHFAGLVVVTYVFFEFSQFLCLRGHGILQVFLLQILLCPLINVLYCKMSIL